MNNPNNQNPQNFTGQNLQNPQQNGQVYPQADVSKNEMFVGTNILSKIGVIFIIIGIIAFSAASKGYLPDGARFALVMGIGVIMLACGEFFFRRKSVAFANALIYGGIAELFISVPIGEAGLKVLPSIIAPVVGLVISAAGFLLSARYKSQGLFIITLLFSTLPIFTSGNIPEMCIAAGCLVAVHCAAAILARKNNYRAAYILGSCVVLIQGFIVFFDGIFLSIFSKDTPMTFDNIGYVTIIALVFVLCCGFCYLSGMLLNGAENEGNLFSWETSALSVSSAAMILLPVIFMCTGYGRYFGGVTVLVISVLFAITAVGFAMAFGSNRSVVTALSNIVLAGLSISVLILFCSSNASLYIAFHIFAAAILAIGVFLDKKLFRVWGYSLLVFAEMLFLGVIAGNKIWVNSPERVTCVIINLVLWFGIMAFYLVKKKTDSTGFRVYSSLAFLNGGILLSNLIFNELSSMLTTACENDFVSFLLCTLFASCLWIILGFVLGKLKYMKDWGMTCSFVFYGISFIFLLESNTYRNVFASEDDKMLTVPVIAAIIAVNLVSVLTVLDITSQITKKQPKFAKAVGLIVSGYGVLVTSSLLGINGFVEFTSWIISVIYIVTAAIWIFVGFKKYNTLLRRFGLALALLACAKLFLLDFAKTDNMTRTLLFIGFGVTLLVISFGYGIAEKKLKNHR